MEMNTIKKLAHAFGILGCALLVACSDPWTETDLPDGVIRGYVRDQTPSGINGVQVALRHPGGRTSRAVTYTPQYGGESGYYVFLFLPDGEYVLSVTPPSGYRIASGQQNPIHVTIMREETRTVDFTLAGD
jgi:hypothetical protein